MSTFSKSCFFLAFFFACICYAVCSFFFDTKYTIMLSLFTGAIFYIVFSIFDRYYSKKAVNSLDELVEEPLFQHIANYYDDKLVGSGWLLLTETDFIFIALDKKNFTPVRIPINKIASIEYNTIFKHIQGMKIIKTNEGEIGFAVPPQEFENIKKLFDSIRYGGSQ